VREKHDAAREAFLLWIDNGRPRQGSICDEMRKLRAHFKLALWYCRQQIEQMKADTYTDAVYDKDARKFWNTVQRISNSKAASLINSVNNVLGEQNTSDMYCIVLYLFAQNHIENFHVKKEIKAVSGMCQEHTGYHKCDRNTLKKLYNSCSNTTHRDKLYAKVKCKEQMNNVVNLHAVSV